MLEELLKNVESRANALNHKVFSDYLDKILKEPVNEQNPEEVYCKKHFMILPIYYKLRMRWHHDIRYNTDKSVRIRFQDMLARGSYDFHMTMCTCPSDNFYKQFSKGRY